MNWNKQNPYLAKITSKKLLAVPGIEDLTRSYSHIKNIKEVIDFQGRET